MKRKMEYYLSLPLSWAFNKILPERTRRLILLSSLVALIADDKIDKETISKLNKMLNLCHNEDAMLLPIKLSSVIWHHKTGADILNTNYSVDVTNTNKFKTITSTVIDAVPMWLIYKHKAMVSDIEELLKEYSPFKNAH